MYSLPFPRPSMTLNLMQWPSQLLDSVIHRPTKGETLPSIPDALSSAEVAHFTNLTVKAHAVSHCCSHEDGIAMPFCRFTFGAAMKPHFLLS